jgi:hypothetical protein
MAFLRRSVASVAAALLLVPSTALAAYAAGPGPAAEPGSAAGPAGVAGPHSSGGPPLARKGTGYTYWGYYQWDPQGSTWAFAPVGANDTKQLPEDGDVYGFRWALVVGQDTRPPRADGDFDAICADTEATSGQKRLAFVLDYGTDDDAPEGDQPPQPRGVCAAVDEGFTTQQALATVADVRTDDSGLICGIDGYPSSGCGEQVKDVQAPPADQPVDLALSGSDEAAQQTAQEDPAASQDAEESDDSGFSLPLVAAIAVAVAAGVGALVVRRNRT